MILDLLDGGFPAADRVALRAVGTKLAPMNVCVTIGAILADIGKDRLDVTLGAANLFVHPAQRIVRAVVVELKIGADRTPAAGRMAVLTRNCERSVGTTSAIALAM